MDEDQSVEAIEKEYFNSLLNLEVQNPRLMILFSGPPGSGKSVLARQIAEKFSAIRLENDELRRLVHAHYPNQSPVQRSEITYKCMGKCWNKLLTESSNGLWVIDASIDRRYKFAFDFANNNSFHKLIIAIRLPEKVNKGRILEREGNSSAHVDAVLKHMAQCRTEQELFLENHNPDMIVSESTDNEDVLNLVHKKLVNL